MPSPAHLHPLADAHIASNASHACAAQMAAAAGGGLGVSDDTTEFHDAPEELAAKVAHLAALVRLSRRMEVYTGAGLSTRCRPACPVRPPSSLRPAGWAPWHSPPPWRWQQLRRSS